MSHQYRPSDPPTELPVQHVDVHPEPPVGVPEAAPDAPKTRKAKASQVVAFLMDEILGLPGTKFKVGLDPVMGLLPGGGDMASGTISCVALFEAMRRGLPSRAIRQMMGNIMLNAGVGTIPVIGDIFSLIFRSNSRNRDIINRELAALPPEGQRKANWWPIISVMLFMVMLIVGAICLNLFIWYSLTHWVFQSFSAWIG